MSTRPLSRQQYFEAFYTVFTNPVKLVNVNVLIMYYSILGGRGSEKTCRQLSRCRFDVEFDVKVLILCGTFGSKLSPLENSPP